MNSNCQHCQSPASRSVVLESSAAKLVLFCSACEKSYKTPDRRHTVLSCRRNHPCSTEKIDGLERVGIGDLIQYKDSSGDGSIHHALCTEIDRLKSELCIVEASVTSESGTLAISRRLTTADLLRLQEAFVFRYMPLDCLPLHDTLYRARKSLQKQQGGREEFANGLKTGCEEQVIISSTDLISNCPNCGALLSQSDLEGTSGDRQILLQCSACNCRYGMWYNKAQKSRLGWTIFKYSGKILLTSAALAVFVRGYSLASSAVSSIKLLHPDFLQIPPDTFTFYIPEYTWKWLDYISPNVLSSIPSPIQF